MKSRSMSLGIYVSHKDRPISVLAARLGNSYWQMRAGAGYLGAQNTVLLGIDAAIVESEEVW